MSSSISGKDYRTGNLKGHAGWLLAVGLAIGVLFLAGPLDLDVAAAQTQPLSGPQPLSGAPTPRPEAPVAGATYEGDIEEASADCGGGTISVSVSDDGASVVEIAVEGVSADGESVSGSATFEPGAVPIADSGGFAAYFTTQFAVDGHEVTVNGTFDGGALDGQVTVSPSTCGALDFGSLAFGLPATGSGPTGGYGPGAAPWMALVAALGAAGLGAGLWLRRRNA